MGGGPFCLSGAAPAHSRPLMRPLRRPLSPPPPRCWLLQTTPLWTSSVRPSPGERVGAHGASLWGPGGGAQASPADPAPLSSRERPPFTLPAATRPHAAPSPRHVVVRGSLKGHPPECSVSPRTDDRSSSLSLSVSCAAHALQALLLPGGLPAFPRPSATSAWWTGPHPKG